MCKIFFYTIQYITIFIISALFVLLPFFYQQKMYSGTFNADLYLIFIVGCICWAGNFIIPFRVNFIIVILLLFLAYSTSTFFAVSHNDNNSVIALISIFLLLGILLSLQAIINHKNYCVIIIAVSISYILQLYLGYKQAFNNRFESLSIQGWLANSGYYANYLTSLLPLLLSIAIIKSTINRNLKLLSLVLFSLSAILLLFTLARSAIIGLSAGCIFIFYIKHKEQIIKIVLRRNLFFFVLSFIALATGFIFYELYKIKIPSANGRLTIYRVCLDIIKDYPLFGVGPNRFTAVYNNYQSNYFLNHNISIQIQLLATNTFEAFNIFLQALVEYGIIGLPILLLLTFYTIKIFTLQAKSNNILKKWLLVGSFGSLIAIFVSGLFSNPLHASPTLLMTIFHVAVISSFDKKLYLAKLHLPKTILYSLFPILLIVLFLILKYSYLHFQAEKKWFKASELSNLGNYQEAKKLYQSAYPILYNNGNFLFNYGAEVSLDNDILLSNSLLEKSLQYTSYNNVYLFLGNNYAQLGNFELAEKNYTKAIYIVPAEIYPKYELLKFYIKYDKIEKAKVWIDKILSTPIKIQSSDIDSMIYEVKEIKLKLSGK